MLVGLNFTRKKLRKRQRLLAKSPGFRLSGPVNYMATVIEGSTPSRPNARSCSFVGRDTIVRGRSGIAGSSASKSAGVARSASGVGMPWTGGPFTPSRRSGKRKFYIRDGAGAVQERMPHVTKSRIRARETRRRRLLNRRISHSGARYEHRIAIAKREQSA